MFSDDKMPVEEVTVSSDSDPAVTNSLFCAVKMQDESSQLSSGVFGLCVTSAHPGGLGDSFVRWFLKH